MAAPMRTFCRKFCHNFNQFITTKSTSLCVQTVHRRTLSTNPNNSNRRVPIRTGIFGSLAVAGTVSLALALNKYTKVHAAEAKKERPQIKPSKEVRIPSDPHGLKLTLYQYSTCPFCCKLRAFLDYYGFSYDIIEVNSIKKDQIKWSDYKKVPILVIEGVGKNGYLQLNDSTVIISILGSFLVDKTFNLEKLMNYYPMLEERDAKGKIYREYQNKYFIMYQDQEGDKRSPEARKEERKWRNWTDSDLVHMISPNCYRTLSEALETFRYFDKYGEWEKNFSSTQRLAIIYSGAFVMWLIGKRIKRKYNLKEDVRESLYDHCRQWTKQVGKKKFHGGDRPDLADLSVYGVLTSMEGCTAFKDALDNTKIGPWFYRMKDACENHKGIDDYPALR